MVSHFDHRCTSFPVSRNSIKRSPFLALSYVPFGTSAGLKTSQNAMFLLPTAQPSGSGTYLRTLRAFVIKLRRKDAQWSRGTLFRGDAWRPARVCLSAVDRGVRPVGQCCRRQVCLDDCLSSPRPRRAGPLRSSIRILALVMLRIVYRIRGGSRGKHGYTWVRG